MIIGLIVALAYISGILSRLLYERWRVAKKTSPKAIKNKEAIIKAFEDGQLWTSSYNKVPQFTVLEFDDDHLEVTTYAEDIDELLFPDKTYLLSWREINSLLGGYRVRMQYEDELFWRPNHKVRWAEDNNSKFLTID